MSIQISSGAKVIGKLMGFSKRWNPFSTEVFAMVEVDATIINVPIDYRQKSMIQKEHPIDSLVPLIFNEGRWEITSNMPAVDQRIFNDSSTVF